MILSGHHVTPNECSEYFVAWPVRLPTKLVQSPGSLRDGRWTSAESLPIDQTRLSDPAQQPLPEARGKDFHSPARNLFPRHLHRPRLAAFASLKSRCSPTDLPEFRRCRYIGIFYAGDRLKALNVGCSRWASKWISQLIQIARADTLVGR